MFKRTCLSAAMAMVVSVPAFAAKKTDADNLGVAPINVPAPSYDFMTDGQILDLAKNFAKEAKRRPSNGAVASEDLMSPELVAFRNKIVKARDADEFQAILKDVDANYDAIPASANDLKFVAARMVTFLPWRGATWRLTPLVHNIVITQQMLLMTMRNMAEQVMIHEPDSHLLAQMGFLTIPDATVIDKPFKSEEEFSRFMATDVYQSLSKAMKRLEKLQMTNVSASGKDSPMVYDAKIRFGEHAFNNDYAGPDRFKLVGEADRFATLARYHRRMAAISQAAAYNWNGHLGLRRDIGRKFGVDAAISSAFDFSSNNVFIDGVTREDRVSVLRNAKYAQLYTLKGDTGKAWMKNAYKHLHQNWVYLDQAWTDLKKREVSDFWQLDPEIFQARKEQVESGLANMKELVGKDEGQSVARIHGAMSGETLAVNLKGFFENPPKDMKALLPTQFAHNEDVMPLKTKYEGASFDGRHKDVMNIKVAGKPVAIRNYFYGRATGWDKGAYSVLFPDLKSGADVMTAQRILAETRGARALSMGIGMFVR